MQVRKTHHHKWKSHLARLPRVDDFPAWQGTSKFACMTVPIFSFDESTQHIESYVAKAAAWSLKSWRENSDARLFNIPCFIYVENRIAHSAIPILVENGVPYDAIMTADYDHTERLAKCLQPIFDDRLKEYEYVMMTDVDMFAVKGENGKSLPFFENIKRHAPTGFGCKVLRKGIPQYWIPNFANLAKYKNREVGEDETDAWFQVMGELTGRTDLRQFYDGGLPAVRPWTGIMVAHRDAFDAGSRTLIETAACTLGDDEAVMLAWIYSREQSQVWDMGEINIQVFLDLSNYINYAYRHTGSNTDKDNVVFEHIYCTEPFLLHHFASHDYKFMDLLGATS